jgi:rod shape determining protein RodA
MALGGVGGSWLGGDAEAGPRALFVPESHTDSISVVLRERFGLWGWGAMLGLYWLLVWRGLAIATQTREPFGRLAAIGIVSLLATQVLINTGMHLGLLPITGLTLPLISYGGSSLLATALGLGLLLNIGLRPGYEITNEPFRFH